MKLGGEGCYSTGVLFQFKNPRPGHNTQKKNHFYLAKQNLWEGNICQWLSFDKRTSSTVGWVVGGGRLTADVSRGCMLSPSLSCGNRNSRWTQTADMSEFTLIDVKKILNSLQNKWLLYHFWCIYLLWFYFFFIFKTIRCIACKL